MPTSRRFLVGSTSAFLLIGFVALLTIVAMNVWLGERAQSYFDDAIAARNTRVAAVELRNAMQTAESSQRGFLITGNEIYLAPFQAAKIQAQRHLSALQTLLLTYPDSDVLLKRLTAIVGDQVRRARADDRAQAGPARRRSAGRVSQQQRQGSDGRSQCVSSRGSSARRTAV